MCFAKIVLMVALDRTDECDGMSVEILCTALCDFRAKSVGAVSKKKCFASMGLMVALEEGHVRNEGWRLWA